MSALRLSLCIDLWKLDLPPRPAATLFLLASLSKNTNTTVAALCDRNPFGHSIYVPYRYCHLVYNKVNEEHVCHLLSILSFLTVLHGVGGDRIVLVYTGWSASSGTILGIRSIV